MEQSQKYRLTDKGSKVPIAKLMGQGRVTVELCRKYREDLSNTGWPVEKTEELDQKLFALDAVYSGRSAETETSLKATEIEASARQGAKAFIRRIRLAAPLVLKNTSIEGVTEDAFNTKDRLGYATPRISKYLVTIKPFVQKLEEQLKVYFAGKSPTAELEKVKAALDKADALQETLRTGLPKETANIYLIAGEILELIQTVNRIAKIAFDGKAEIIGQFNKDLLLRGGKTRKKANEGEEQLAAG